MKAVSHCHAMGIAHCDIKPDNVLMSEDGDIKLIDFGLSRQVEKRIKNTTLVGTPHYIAPEVINEDFDTQ